MNQAQWFDKLDGRQQSEVEFCQLYAEQFDHGTDGHNLRKIVAKLAGLLNQYTADALLLKQAPSGEATVPEQHNCRCVEGVLDVAEATYKEGDIFLIRSTDPHLAKMRLPEDVGYIVAGPDATIERVGREPVEFPDFLEGLTLSVSVEPTVEP